MTSKLNKKPYDPQILKSLYIDQNKSAKELAVIFGKTKKAIQHWIFNEKLRKQVPVFWDESLIDYKCPIFNYLMGLAATDGCIDSNSFRLSIRLKAYDRQVLDSLSKHFRLSTGVRLYRNNAVADLTLPSKLLVKVAESFNVTKQKTFTLEVPRSFYSDECLRLYMRGVIEGDGSLKINGQGISVRLYCGSEKFVEGLIDLIQNKFNFSVKKKFQKTKDKLYPGFEFGGLNAIVFLEWIYKDYPSFRIERKFERFNTVCKNRMKI